MPASLLVTHHAQQRAVQRLGLTRREARAGLAQAWHRSAKLPARHAASLMRRRRRHRKDGVEYRVAGSCFLVCRGRTIITVWKLHVEELATVIAWLLTGRWCDEEGPPGVAAHQ